MSAGEKRDPFKGLSTGGEMNLQKRGHHKFSYFKPVHDDDLDIPEALEEAIDERTSVDGGGRTRDADEAARDDD